jgi:hypothetical protein
MTDFASRIMAEMQSERGTLGLLDGRPLPVEARDRVLNRMCALFVAEATKAKRKPKVSEITDAEWIESLEHEPALKGIVIKQQLALAQLWAKQNKRVATRRFLMNWFMRAEKVVDLKAAGATHATGLKLPPPQGPSGWLDWLKVELSLLSPEADAYSQLTAALNCKQFSMMPQSWQNRCRQANPQSA